MLLRVIVISIPVLMALWASTLAFAKEKTLTALVQLTGALCLLLVIFAHTSEAVGFLPSMGWGQPNTAGHYIDLASAIIGVTLLTVGYLLRRLFRRRISN